MTNRVAATTRMPTTVTMITTQTATKRLAMANLLTTSTTTTSLA